MRIPKLRRVRVSSEPELRVWLAKNAGPDQEVMIVTCDKRSKDKHVSSAQVRAALQDLGWSAGQSYTLIGNLSGHVARRG